MVRIGRVRWFNPHFGYGFLSAAEDGQDVFFHYTVIPDTQEGSKKTIRKGQAVRYKRKKHDEGLAAYWMELM